MSKTIIIEFETMKLKVDSDKELVKFLNTIPLNTAKEGDINTMLNYFNIEWPHNHNVWDQTSVPEGFKGWVVGG